MLTTEIRGNFVTPDMQKEINHLTMTDATYITISLA
jgi:hypothetical protein